MPEKTHSQLEGPAGYNGGNPPGEALKMPTKHYPQSQPNKGGGKGSTLEGPGTVKK